MDCLVILPVGRMATGVLQSVLPPVIPHVWAGARFDDVATIIRRASREHGLVFCDPAVHFDRGDLKTWPKRLADESVGWMSVTARAVPLTQDPRRRHFELFGAPAIGRWATTTLLVDQFGGVPPSGLRVIKEAIASGTDPGYEHPLSRHLLRSGFAEQSWLATTPTESGRRDEAIVRADTRERIQALESKLASGLTAIVHLFDSDTAFGNGAVLALREAAEAANATMTTFELSPDLVEKPAPPARRRRR